MSDGRFEQITASVKRRYETGEYGNAHFRMPGALFAEVRATAPLRRLPLPFMSSDVLRDLLSIPVVVDEGLLEGTWRLVDNSTDEILFEGRTDG